MMFLEKKVFQWMSSVKNNFFTGEFVPADKARRLWKGHGY